MVILVIRLQHWGGVKWGWDVLGFSSFQVLSLFFCLFYFLGWVGGVVQQTVYLIATKEGAQRKQEIHSTGVLESQRELKGM